jgi:hypothetical protein
LRGVGIISLPNSRREIDGHKGAHHINYKFSLSAFLLFYGVFEDEGHFRKDTTKCKSLSIVTRNWLNLKLSMSPTIFPFTSGSGSA